MVTRSTVSSSPVRKPSLNRFAVREWNYKLATWWLQLRLTIGEANALKLNVWLRQRSGRESNISRNTADSTFKY